MRRTILFLAWSGVVGAVFDSAITIFALIEIALSPDVVLGMSVDQHLKDHLTFLYWIKDVAYVLLPDTFVDWLFDLPALAYFPSRIFVNAVMGYWMFRWATKMTAAGKN